MASTIAKTVVATGTSSGVGLEAIKQLMGQKQPYKFILGVRDVSGTQAALEKVKTEGVKHDLSVLRVDLTDFKAVKSFAQQTLEKLGSSKLDFLFLNAGRIQKAEGPGPNGSKWCEAYVTNHLSQHYLVHLLREKLVASQSRIVVTSSGAVRAIKDQEGVAGLDKVLLANSGGGYSEVYSASKFTQLLGANWWRRQLSGQCRVVAVSPGLIPGTSLGRDGGFSPAPNHPDAKTNAEGGASLVEAFTRDDFPEDPERIFLTSWGEWWEKDVYGTSLDKALQDKWSPSKEEIEREAGITA